MMVVGIGQCSWDYLALVDRFPPEDTKKEVLRWEEQGGGPVATALVALRRLGMSTRFHGVVGEDPAGERIQESLKAEGVDAGGLLLRPGATSQTAFIVAEQATGRRTIYWRRPSGAPLGAKELGPAFLKGARFLHLDGLMAEASLHAAREARRRSIPAMLDAGRLREGMLDVAREVPFVVASEEFARDLGMRAGGEEEFLRRAEGMFPGTFTVTLGARGSLTRTPVGRVFHVPAFEVEAVDTTGAGDVFHGGYIYGLLRGWELLRTVRFAAALAALACRRPGGRAGIPGLTEVEGFLSRRTERPES
jgi:sulfofructose kinase